MDEKATVAARERKELFSQEVSLAVVLRLPLSDVERVQASVDYMFPDSEPRTASDLQKILTVPTLRLGVPPPGFSPSLSDVDPKARHAASAALTESGQGDAP